ncbi:MAG: Ig-like domain-containing protein [Coprococcus sp.]
MAIKPKQATLNANSVEILNTIRNSATPYYKQMIPQAKANTGSIRQIGNIMMNYEPLQNEFLSALYNRIGRVIITSKMYYNPWSPFKKGLMELGETVEEIFVNIAKAHTFNPETAETNFMKREIPDVRAAFHTMNYQKFYKATISNDQLRQAFLSWQGITDLIAKIVDAMYTAHNYDEFQVMKYMLARNILNGYLYPVTVAQVDKENAPDIVTEIKAISNELVYESPDYNLNGVYTFTEKNDQFIITNARFDAVMDVNVLASAFNMDKVEFMGHRVQIDGFDRIDENRMNELFADDPNAGYIPLTEDEKAALKAVPAVLIDRDYFMIFDNLYKFTEDYNGEGLYWQYWYHAWKTFSTSPFANAVIFVPGTPGVTSVTVSPATATVNKGAMLQLNAAVVTDGFAPKSVVWSINSELSTITQSGLLSVSADETAATITVTATSTFDGSKVGTATITVPA